MLVTYPFAFLTGGWAFGIAGAMWRQRDLETVSNYLLPTGVAAGLLAAVPGIIDYRYSVPPASSGKQRGTKHALINTTALALFTAGWVLGRGSRRVVLPLALKTLGAAAISVGGWMGGTLAYRNQIGVDHRYANAGTWKEDIRESGQASALTSAAAALEVNQMKLVRVNEDRIVVARTERGPAAFQDRCTHRGGPLSDGALICGIVQCPWHGSQFDVETGEVRCGPAQQNIRTYEIAPTHVPLRSA